ncbi:hypothetical protein I3200192J8_13410 [Faecalibacillus intestinalis]|jgi:hypothetical protein
MKLIICTLLCIGTIFICCNIISYQLETIVLNHEKKLIKIAIDEISKLKN